MNDIIFTFATVPSIVEVDYRFTRGYNGPEDPGEKKPTHVEYRYILRQKHVPILQVDRTSGAFKRNKWRRMT